MHACHVWPRRQRPTRHTRISPHLPQRLMVRIAFLPELWNLPWPLEGRGRAVHEVKGVEAEPQAGLH
jgi:hypothetical protein